MHMLAQKQVYKLLRLQLYSVQYNKSSFAYEVHCIQIQFTLSMLEWGVFITLQCHFEYKMLSGPRDGIFKLNIML